MPTLSKNLQTATTEQVIARIKARANRLILEAAPDFKQRNAIARTVEFERIMRNGGTLSASEEVEQTAIDALWVWVKAVRVLSNQLEAAAIAGETIDVVAGTCASYPDGWPE